MHGVNMPMYGFMKGLNTRPAAS